MFSDDTEIPPQAAIIVSILISLFFPVVGPLIILKLTKGKDSEAAKLARRAAIAVLVISIIVIVARFGIGYFDMF